MFEAQWIPKPFGIPIKFSLLSSGIFNEFHIGLGIRIILEIYDMTKINNFSNYNNFKILKTILKII